LAERETYFVDVLVPLPLATHFTYRVPFKYNDIVAIGKRVVVQFGSKKLYAGIIVNIHQRIPDHNNVKYILNVLDNEPIVTDLQLKFWKWLSEYYMAYEGEIMNAALPSALKLASESKLLLNPDCDLPKDQLTDKEFLIVQALEINHTITLTDVSDIIEQKKIMPIIKTLIEKGFVIPEEDIRQKYRPKTEAYVRLAEFYQNENELENITKELEKKAFKQLELLLAYLQYSKYFSGSIEEISKSKLLKKSGITANILTALVKKQVLEIYDKSQSRLQQFSSTKSVDDLILSEKQNKTLTLINNYFDTKDVCLLHGITGSGKTEIYIKLIEEQMKLGKQVLFLVPEIALTAQIINRLKFYFGDKLGFYHSRYGNNERVEVWQNLLKNTNSTYQVIIGARSSIFLPFSNLGLIIIDEEHDASYKQYDPSPRYYARDSALVLAKFHNAKCLLGSATPSLESYHKAIKGDYGFVELNERYSRVRLPEILIVDTADATKKKEMKSHFSVLLLEHMKVALDNKEQIILFQNRRGFSLRLVCDSCQWTPECNHCDVTLTYHKQLGRLKCHYCGSSKDVPTMCPNCGSHKLSMKGFGTEKIEEELPLFFPDAVVKRMDLDTTRNKNAYIQIINDFQDKRIDILVGTQMVSKGLDFGNVGLVGVMNADNMLHYPDFRAYERSFQQLTQVSGRSGRKSKRGKVIIQTSQPYHSVIRDVIDNDYKSMYKSQMEERANFKYPPFYRIIKISLKHKDYNLLNAGSRKFADLLRPKLGARVLGPEYPMVSRIRNLYIKNILIKFEIKASHKAVKDIIYDAIYKMQEIKEYRSILINPDIDPM
jgi:primosomal protein N' (replication factor Y)